MNNEIASIRLRKQHDVVSHEVSADTVDNDLVAAATERWGDERWEVIAFEAANYIPGWLAEAYGFDDPYGRDLVYGRAIYDALDDAGLVGGVRDGFGQHAGWGVALPDDENQWVDFVVSAIAHLPNPEDLDT